MMRKTLVAVCTVLVCTTLVPAFAAEAPAPVAAAPAKVAAQPATSPAAAIDPVHRAPAVGIASPIGSAAPSFAREPEAGSAGAPQSKLACPSALRTLIATVDGEVKGWVVGGTEQTMPLKGARLFSGPVAEQTIERFNELTAIPFMDREKGEFEQVWTLDEKLLQTGIMIVCDYSGSSNFLMRAVPPGTKTCKEVDPIDKSDASVTTVSCQ